MSTSTNTGLDMEQFGVGASITAIEYVVPTHYGACVDGAVFGTLAEAIELGIRHYNDLRDLHREAGGQQHLPESITVDQRVRFSGAHGGSIDTVAQRIVFPTLVDAEHRLTFIAHVARLR